LFSNLDSATIYKTVALPLRYFGNTPH